MWFIWILSQLSGAFEVDGAGTRPLRSLQAIPIGKTRELRAEFGQQTRGGWFSKDFSLGMLICFSLGILIGGNDGRFQ